MPETANVRISQANIIEQNGRLMLLGNTAENGKLTANEGSLGILFKVTHLQEHEKNQLAAKYESQLRWQHSQRFIVF